MKKWHVVLVVSFLAVVLLTVSGVLVYKYYLMPKYIEPIVEDISEYVKQEEVLDKLYDEAVVLHDDGVIEDEIYSKFVRAYNTFKRDDVEYAQNVLEEHQSQDTLDAKNNSLSTKYASYKVGVETIQTNDTGENGKADVRYSDERTSDRIKAEDVVEAEKIIEEADKETPTPDAVKSAYEKLRTHMTAEEFSFFTKIMRKLDVDTLKTFLSDKEGLKAYLHENLTDEEYSKSVNLGYKYIYIFIDE